VTNEKREAVARAICRAAGGVPDAMLRFKARNYVAGRLSDTGHDSRITETYEYVIFDWQRHTHEADMAIAAYECAT